LLCILPRALDALAQRVLVRRGDAAIGGTRHAAAVVVRERGAGVGERVAGDWRLSSLRGKASPYRSTFIW
jgi:hypothetical protein